LIAASSSPFFGSSTSWRRSVSNVRSLKSLGAVSRHTSGESHFAWAQPPVRAQTANVAINVHRNAARQSDRKESILAKNPGAPKQEAQSARKSGAGGKVREAGKACQWLNGARGLIKISPIG
jgi:hypothetical protein